ncbi:MAG: regulatory iron-sulfur-containing complex subunit RicT [Planctomycetota bacterium]|nr:regulatory iron-sulfur-containing complex subunit RicT [Planctomycetota bacterium]
MPKYVVRFGTMRSLGVMSARGGDRHGRGTEVVARTNRGMEVGEVLCEASEQAISNLKNPTHGQILRAMTSEDLNEASHIRAQEADEFTTCKRMVAELGLQMELVDMEHLFGGERIVIYYLAEDRIDFRDLVKQLAAEFQTRIEMRQIGVRDEAKLLADYGDCGQPVCCNTHLSEMPPVSMKMAKLQKATLDPTKISGRCGRLKCCLRYEYDTYEEIHKDLPPIGSEILTRNGRAHVLGQEILSEQLLVETEDRRRVLIPASDVLTIVQRGKGRPRRSGDPITQPKESQTDSPDGTSKPGRGDTQPDSPTA